MIITIYFLILAILAFIIYSDFKWDWANWIVGTVGSLVCLFYLIVGLTGPFGKDIIKEVPAKITRIDDFFVVSSPDYPVQTSRDIRLLEQKATISELTKTSIFGWGVAAPQYYIILKEEKKND